MKSYGRYLLLAAWPFGMTTPIPWSELPVPRDDAFSHSRSRESGLDAVSRDSRDLGAVERRPVTASGVRGRAAARVS